MAKKFWRAARAVIATAALALVVAGCARNTAKLAELQRTAALQPASAEAQAATVVRKSDLPEPPAEPDWRDHFKNVSKGAILVQLDARRLSYWGPGGEDYREFPIGVPRSDDLERTGVTKVVRRRKNPDWRPTPSMIERNPKLPKYVGPGPHNPLGERALYLGWQYYAIHGTNNPASIGRRATSGCIRLFPEHIEWLYDQVGVGTPVKVVDSL